MTTIVGAGLAGLIAGNLINGASILEVSEAVPNNHSAVLRFRTSIVGDTLDIPFRNVKMIKAMMPWRNAIADQLAYSYKCTGTATIRSAITADATVQDRWIAPDDLIDQLYKRISKNIGLGVNWTGRDDVRNYPSDCPIINTMPMPVLMKMLKWEQIPEFKYVHGFNINCTLTNVDAYVSLYVPTNEPFNRISLTGNKLTIEYSYPFIVEGDVANYRYQLLGKVNDHINEALEHLGVAWRQTKVTSVELKNQKYSKILPIDDEIRKRFIMWASDKFGIYSLGRYATWRPGLLLDDLINDIRVIKKLIGGKSQYDYKV